MNTQQGYYVATAKFKKSNTTGRAWISVEIRGTKTKHSFDYSANDTDVYLEPIKAALKQFRHPMDNETQSITWATINDGMIGIAS